MRTVIFLVFVSLLVFQCNSRPSPVSDPYFQPKSNALYDTILQLDSVLFQAYNTCDTGTLMQYFYDDVEFYHNQVGLIVSKDYLRTAFLQHDCGTVRRERIAESIEVYPIPNFGAIEIGKHRFFNKKEENTQPPLGKFVFIWRNQKDSWKLYRVVNLLRN